MEGRTAAKIFISLGLLAGFLGFLIGNFFLNFAVFTLARIIAINIIIIGISIGFNWIVVGVVLALAKREVGEGGFLSCLFFGIWRHPLAFNLFKSRERF